MGAPLMITPQQEVHKIRLTAAAGSKHKFVTVGDQPLLHRLIRDVHEQGYTRSAVPKPDTEGARRTDPIGFGDDETRSLRRKRQKARIDRKAARIARNAGKYNGRS